MQTDVTLFAIVGIFCVHLQIAESLTGFKLCATTPNNLQVQGVQTDESFNIQQFGSC